MKGLTCRMSDSTPRRSLFVQGLRYGLPILLGYVPVSFAFAVTAVGSGLPWYLVLAISMTNFTSAGQAAGSGLLAAGGPLPEIGVTVFVINIRYMLMSLSLSQRLEGMSLGKRLLVANGVTDEIFFLAMQKPGNRLSGWFFTGLALGPYAGWVGGTLAGALAGAVLPASLTSALGVALYAMFIAIVIPTVRDSSRAGPGGGPGGAAVLPVPLRAGPERRALRLGADSRGGDRFGGGSLALSPRRAARGCRLVSTPVYYALGVLVMAVVTYIPRVLPLSLMRRRVESRFLQSFLYYMPYAVLGAMTFPAILEATATPWSAAVGMAVALILAYLRLNLLPVALASTASVFVVEWAMGLYR